MVGRGSGAKANGKVVRMLTKKQYQLLIFIDERLRSSGISPSFDEMKEALGLRSKSGIHRLINALEERGFLRRLAHRARALEVIRLPENFAAPARAEAPRPEVAPPEGWRPEIWRPETSLPESARTPAPRAEDDGRDDRAATALPSNVVRGAFRPAATPRLLETVQLPLYGRIAAGTPIEALANPAQQIDLPASFLGPGEHYALEVEGDSMIEAGIHDGDTVIIRRCDSADNGSIVVALVDNVEVTLKRIRRHRDSIALGPANAAYKPRICGPDQVKVQGRLVALFRHY